LKKKLEDLETTETKLKASIDKVEGAVSTNEETNHELNQEAAAASVGGGETSTGEAAAAAAAPAAAEAAPAAAFLDRSDANRAVREAKIVAQQAKKVLNDNTNPFKNLARILS